MDSERDTAVTAERPDTPAPKANRGPGRPTRTNEELLDTAWELFLENGFERTTIDAITAAAGMAKRTVYMRYEDKTALFKAALQRAIERWIVPVEKLRAAETEDVEETLLRIGQILVANVMSPAGMQLLRITNAESGRMPEIGAYSYTQGTAPTIAYLADLFRRRIRPGGGQMADAEEAALAFLFLVVGGPANTTAWGLHLAPEAVDRHTRYSVQVLLHGLLPHEAASPPTPRKLSAAPATAVAADAAEDIRALEDENRRLRGLLVEAMLEVAALKEARENG